MKVGPPHSINLPTQSDVEVQLLRALGLFTRSAEPAELYNLLADHFGLDAAQRHAYLPNTEENAWQNRVRQARRRLVDEGWLDNSEHGLWSLTDAGRARAQRIELPKTLEAEDLGL